MPAAAIHLDECILSPARVVGKNRYQAPPPKRLASWDEIHAQAKRPPQALRRGLAAIRAEYQGGTIQRTNALWQFSASDANRALRGTLATLRGRSRQLERDDPYARRFLALCEANIIGADGVTVQSRITETKGDAIKPDALANKIIEREIAAFSRRGQFDVTGALSRSAFERLLVRTVARDGEALVKFVADPAGRWGVRLQILEADWLDETLNEERPDGTRIIMGVEFAPEGRPVAYWLRQRHPGDSLAAGQSARVRYTANQVRHYFVAQRPGQVRGVPWMHAAMERLYQLGEFNQSALLAARIGADKVMVLEDPEGVAAEWADKQDGSGADATAINAGSFPTARGSIDILPRGVKVADGWDPAYPSDTYAPFTLAALRGIASGVGVSYESLTNDRNGVTWTSIRHAKLDERDDWRVLQDWLIEGFEWDWYTQWLTTAFLSPSRPFDFLPAAKLAKFLSPEFYPRRWDWVNPKDDIEADVTAIENKLTSHRRVLAKQGVDIEDLFSEIAADEALAARYGLSLETVLPKPGPVPEPASTGQKNPAQKPGDDANGNAQ